jgi:rhamnogalacturonyl hydrolase YesR
MGIRRILVTGQLVRKPFTYLHQPTENGTVLRIFDIGNGWAAAGMMRVLATIMRSDFASQMESQQNNLAQWVDEILTGVWNYQVTLRRPTLRRFGLNALFCLQQDNGTLLNYVDQPDSFADSASTALLAATSFRYSALTGDETHDSAALDALDVVFKSIDEDGWLLNTVNPDSWTVQNQGDAHSPEGQSFVLLLAAAWGEY